MRLYPNLKSNQAFLDSTAGNKGDRENRSNTTTETQLAKFYSTKDLVSWKINVMGNKRKEKVEGNCFRLKEVEYTILNRIQYGDFPGSWIKPKTTKKTFSSQHYFPTFWFRLESSQLVLPLTCRFLFLLSSYKLHTTTIFDWINNSVKLFLFQH